MYSKTLKGIFNPKHPEKYKGNAKKIVYRSSWELKLMTRLDTNPLVLWWSSEELHIPYLSPVDGKMHRYFPDFIISRKSSRTGEINTIMIEVKPLSQTVPPSKPQTKDRRKIRRFIREHLTYEVNEAKWTAAREFCANRKWQFVIMTEKELNI